MVREEALSHLRESVLFRLSQVALLRLCVSGDEKDGELFAAVQVYDPCDPRASPSLPI